jgi:hypothetical protein
MNALQLEDLLTDLYEAVARTEERDTTDRSWDLGERSGLLRATFLVLRAARSAGFDDTGLKLAATERAAVRLALSVNSEQERWNDDRREEQRIFQREQAAAEAAWLQERAERERVWRAEQELRKVARTAAERMLDAARREANNGGAQ